MRRPKLGTLSKSFDALLADKRSLEEREHGLIARLNKVLGPLGYRVEPATRSTSSAPKRRRRVDSRGQHVTLKSSEQSSMNHSPKRRGRPPLKKVD